ncbi:hypothetical protein [Streptosporangium sp. NPDC051022]|uniref:hypothetical protein n=1 Tax=Streptosporangium sp. NPDC051022 TaxID=3155752 RepID=UPI00343B9268
MKASKWAAALSTTALLTTGLLMGTTSGAYAIPDNCTTSVSGSTASSYCAGGTGEHYVSVVFRHPNPWIPGLQQISGPWKPAGQTSSVTVNLGTIVSVSVIKR